MGKHIGPLKQRALSPIKRAAGALSAIRIGLAAIAKAHLGAGRVRMMPIYDRTEHDWIDPEGQHHRRIEQDWIGLAWYRDGQLVHEIRWGRRGPNSSIEHDETGKLP